MDQTAETQTKACRKCGQEKPMTAEFFYFRKDWGRYATWCRECEAKNQRAQYDKQPEERKQYGRDYYKTNKGVVSAKNRQRYEDNREEYLAKGAEYRAKHPEVWDEYYQKNKAKISAQRREKKKSDPVLRLRANVSTTINVALKAQGSTKGGQSITKHLPYTILTLMRYIESQFEWWMSWNNYGPYRKRTWEDDDHTTWTWQLDHIIPQSDLPYTSMTDENFKRCWVLENLRPLSAKQNVLEGTKRTRHQSKRRAQGSK